MRGKTKMSRYECKECGTIYSVPVGTEYNQEGYNKTPDFIEKINKENKLVITSIVLGHEPNTEFLEALETYCGYNKAKLLIIPIKYRIADAIPELETGYEKYFISTNFEYKDQYKIMGAMKLNASLENPLAGLDSLSKGYNVIFAHPQVALKTVPVDSGYPGIISTTGCASEKTYSDSKQGYKATFNHSHSAIILEADIDGIVHQRHLNFDGIGFYDLTNYYDSTGTYQHHNNESITEALITGDEHVTFMDDKVMLATYKYNDSIVNTLRPKKIVRHDVLDSYSISHHHKKNVFTNYAKYKDGYNSLADELNETINFIIQTTPSYSKSIIVSSNHHDHILKWLNETDPKLEPWNALLYHQLMYYMLEETSMGENGAEYPNPFELYVKKKFDFHFTSKIEFISRNEKYLVADEVAVNAHGDVGCNGSRGSRKSFSSLPTKHVIGHGHSPGIEKGVYQVGTSSRLRLEYNSGPSSWHHCHCVVYPNGKRQLIFIINGKWKA